MYQTVQSMLEKSGNINHPYLQHSGSPKKLVILITGNRGLAGGYNSNVTKLITRGDFHKEDILIEALGSKGRETMARHDYKIVGDYSYMVEEPRYEDAVSLAKEVLDIYARGEIGELYLAYTHFKNTVVHEPMLVKLLPVEADTVEKEPSEEDRVPMNFEPEDEEALQLIIPKYITSLIYGGLVESVASENGARMQAMDSATSNAEDMISDLTLQYNRARQGSITQELTEIIAGAQAIS
jgi:F-type H+-transporting ATPase subunit gamma